MPSILITGATGNVGSEILRQLVAQGHPVRAAILEAERGRLPASPLIEPVALDFGAAATYGPALDGIERVFLMRPPQISDTKTYIDPFIHTARDRGVRQMVLLSLLGAEKNPIVPHARIEKSMLAAGIPYTFLRPSFFMQNLSTTHRLDIKDHNDIFVPAGRGTTSFIDVRDIAAVAVKTLTEDGHLHRAYPLTGDVALDYYQVADIFTQVLGRRIVYPNPSIPAFIRRMRGRGLNWSYIAVMIGIYTTARLGMAGGVTPDTRVMLGRPTIPMQQFIVDHRDCWR